MKRLIKRFCAWWFRPFSKKDNEVAATDEIKHAIFKNIPQERKEREFLSARLTLIEVGLKNMARQ
jgi:hypothetical protein